MKKDIAGRGTVCRIICARVVIGNPNTCSTKCNGFSKNPKKVTKVLFLSLGIRSHCSTKDKRNFRKNFEKNNSDAKARILAGNGRDGLLGDGRGQGKNRDPVPIVHGRAENVKFFPCDASLGKRGYVSSQA
jgi:hypothetical protein